MDTLANWSSELVDDEWDKSTERRVVEDVVLGGTFVAHADKEVWRKSHIDFRIFSKKNRPRLQTRAQFNRLNQSMFCFLHK